MNQGDNDGGGFSWLTALGLTFLTFNSGMAIYRSDGDRGSVALVVASYLELVLLFVCLRLFERTPRDSPRQEWLKACVWGLISDNHVLPQGGGHQGRSCRGCWLSASIQLT
ncbi:hypothetical protein BAE44_0022559 [Dichanthelium oligosanthes]|uniref:Uncharacterized protein n=1 Tax=Dichanthelium oligosanthes TaxID=888268 RepID=A0A1E5UU16_9POAL|nr:hypothetical protein BAE44_0022559 [Dichanthelium oligosanthes]